MKKITLTVVERIWAMFRINEFKGSLTDLAFVSDDAKKISFTKEEGEAIGYGLVSQKDEKGEATGNLVAEVKNLELADKTTYEIELTDTTIKYLMGIIEENENLALSDVWQKELLEKLKA